MGSKIFEKTYFLRNMQKYVTNDKEYDVLFYLEVLCNVFVFNQN